MKTHILYSFFFNRAVYEICGKNPVERDRLQMVFNYNNVCTNSPQYYIIRTQPTLLLIMNVILMQCFRTLKLFI